MALLAPVAHALTPDQAAAIAIGDTDARIAALNKVAAEADPELSPFIRALLDGEVKTADGKVYVVQGDKAAPRHRRRRHQQQPHARRARSRARCTEAGVT